MSHLVFNQIVDAIHPQVFSRCVERYKGNRRARTFSCRDQFLCMAFAQLSFRESLRDIEACLRSRSNQLYRMGIRGNVSRTNMARANEVRDWRIYADLAMSLVKTARDLYASEPLIADLDEVVYALDATTIDLCMNLFPWAHFRSTKSAVKLHTLLDLRGNIPSFVHITEGKVHDVNALDVIPMEPGAFYVMDRGYVDFDRLYGIHLSGAFFVVRAKRNLDYIRHRSLPIERGSGLVSDHVGRLGGGFASYPELLRRVRFRDPETGKAFAFLTNNQKLRALVVTQLYKGRWQIELFFKWIKQNLRIKAFYGTSANAVKTQVWIAVAVYVLVAIAKKRHMLDDSLHRILQVSSLSLFEQVPLYELLAKRHHNPGDTPSHNQLTLWDF